MFAPAYIGRQRILRMLSFHLQEHFFLAESLFAVYQERRKGRRPISAVWSFFHRWLGSCSELRLQCAWAEMGHPSREEDLVLCSRGDLDELRQGCYPSRISPQRSASRCIVSKNKVGRLSLLVAREARLHKRSVTSFPVREMSESPTRRSLHIFSNP